jgi:fructose-1,6-bisphosphatase/inositol monophosphatase family enzyme
MKFSAAQLRTLGQILRDAAQAEILPRFRNLDAGMIRHKSSPLDLVTDADEAAERRITADLAKAFPAALVVGEEATAQNERLLDGLASAELAIIVDPIDGTKNFASGLPLFGVMAGVVARDEVIAGVIYDPIAEDWVCGLRGEGAWREHLDGSRVDLAVAAPPQLDQMLGLVSWMFLAEPLRSTVTRNLTKVAGAANYRTAAHEYRLVASGHYDFCMYGKLLPWDHAAGVLIHTEAGGYSAQFDGTPYRPSRTTGGILCAADRATWEMLRGALLDA